ncbi:MAG: RNA-binding S4 domain-containing protein [Hydrogenophaga sp.]|uniref:RNA-binding S4 domain-containing protein n=1 Tax=Hydrogenophaga sp. TaxID=1904254 RepID=UPI0025C1963B|nr:RNA-binding S4 domain-containing protein [Hydrogenophaga sp.]MBT9549943.1 RNA-binding S4 domain-containing protein [Hydrogenophaga sp.]
MNHTEPQGSGKVRLDKWLWAARFYKTRSLSAEDIDKGRVHVNGATVKPARELRVGDTVEVRSGPVVRTVTVRALSGVRGPAPVAALLYQETEDSVAQRLANAEQRRLAPEPAQGLTQGRPSKRDRRDMDSLRGRATPGGEWNQRWSASLDDD